MGEATTTHSRPGEVVLRWPTIPAASTTEHPGGLDALLDRTLDGMIVSGVMSTAEIERGLEALEQDQKIPRPFGELLGMALGMSGSTPDERVAYHDDVDRARRRYREAFGFDPHERLAEVLAPMASGLPLVAPLEDGRPYNPGHLRWWTPGGPGLPAHAGNEFRRHLEHGAMKHLLTITRVQHHLSYFVVLEPPDSGGELRVYDLTWETDQGLDDWADALRDDARMDSVPSVLFAPSAGDLVIFGGGWRWHRVDPLTGDRRRVTYGGFAAPALDGSEIHFWA